MRNVYYFAAYFAFWAGQFKEARRYGFQSWRYRPLKFRRLWFFVPLGKQGLKMAEMLQSRAGIVTSPTQLQAQYIIANGDHFFAPNGCF